jgi:cytochrome c peroxidase
MPLFNLAWSPSFAWDGGQRRIRDQTLAAWTNPVEMHADPVAAVAVLQRDAKLAEAFRAAFGSPEITVERVTLALEQYLLTLVSADSKFDRALRGEGPLTAEEQRGFELFATEYDPARGKRGADCFHCHGGALLADYALKNNGLDRDPSRFKTPSLRNVAVTGPYMHDGRMETLEQVVAHYNRGVQRTRGLDPNLAKHPPRGMDRSAASRRHRRRWR